MALPIRIHRGHNQRHHHYHCHNASGLCSPVWHSGPLHGRHSRNPGAVSWCCPFQRRTCKTTPGQILLLRSGICGASLFTITIIITVIITITYGFSHLVGETRPREDKMPRPEGEIIPRGRDMPVGDHDQSHTKQHHDKPIHHHGSNHAAETGHAFW